MDKIEFAKRLSYLREQKGRSAREISEALDKNYGFINSIENGRALPSMSVFFNICEELEVTPKDFFDIDNQNPREIDALIPYLQQLTPEQLGHLVPLIKDMIKSK